MKKVALALIFAALSTQALADPTGLRIAIQCPDANHSDRIVTNQGSNIAGYGQEVIVGVNSSNIYFVSEAFPSGQYPADLTAYYHDNVNYDSTTGIVSCNFLSSQGDKPFSVAYNLTNGKGAHVVDSSSNSLELVLPVGLK